jgi:hypothetical protein
VKTFLISKKFPDISWKLNVKTFHSMELDTFYIPRLNFSFRILWDSAETASQSNKDKKDCVQVPAKLLATLLLFTVLYL